MQTFKERATKFLARLRRAYKKTGRSPIEGGWCKGKTGACPMAVLQLAKGVNGYEVGYAADEEFGRDFVDCFISGYDYPANFLSSRKIATKLGVFCHRKLIGEIDNG